MKLCGEESSSRNGPVIVAPEPVATIYKKPWQRVLFSSVRDANPFFHFFESLWMLSGRSDVAFPALFNSRIATFSDNGVTLNGAYGFRWRTRWFDQLKEVIEHLRENPHSRREVITMWSAGDLIDQSSKDLPCNTHIYVEIRHGNLNITVCCRSNDMWWGAYGANVVHMSFLQEFLASAIGVETGTYTQFSNNFHLYTDLYDGQGIIDNPEKLVMEEMYPKSHYPIMSTSYEDWTEEVRDFIKDCLQSNSFDNFKEKFLNEVAVPMFRVWKHYKAGNMNLAISAAAEIKANDWSLACLMWLQRRIKDAY